MLPENTNASRIWSPSPPARVGCSGSSTTKSARQHGAIFPTGRPLARYGLEPRHTIFIDDREDNVRAAEALGLDGIRFDGSDALRDALAARGLLT